MSKKRKKKAKVTPIKSTSSRDGLTSFYGRMGGLVNMQTGMGITSKSSQNMFARGVLNEYEQWEAAYETNWIARRVIDVVADDVTANWRNIKSEESEKIHKLENELSLKHSVNEAIRWSRLYGGGAILMLTGQPLDKPLNLEAIKEGDLDRLIVLDRWSMNTGDYNLTNILQDNFLRPEWYTLSYASTNPTIHYSHFALFYGDPLPLRLLQQTNGWGDSVLRRGIEEIKNLQAAVNGIAELLAEANVDIVNVEGSW